jgi:uncharacterized protein (DUF952 family)
MQDLPELVYKILRPSERATFERYGRFIGSPDDDRDGFVHLSTREQLAGTLAKHFEGEAGLTILALDVAAMGSALRWEESRGGALFPHLYGAILASMVREELDPESLVPPATPA